MSVVAAGDASGRAAQTLIAGGGLAALEAALALRALAADRVALTILAPDPVFHYRPAATTEPFDVSPSRRYGPAGDRPRPGGRVSRVAPRVGRVAQALCAHGRRRPSAVWDIDPGDRSPLRGGRPRGGHGLALLTARHARERRLATNVTVVSSEREPLELFGTQASQLVRGLLEKAGVRFRGGAVAAGVQRDRSLALADGETVQADHVVALPELRARRIAGVPAKRAGFVPVDALGRVEGIQDVYAAGDMTTFPIKQGGLAAQQADVVAQTIAARLGVSIKEVRPPRVLQARLLGGEPALFLRTEFDWTGQPTRATLVHADDEDAAKTPKVLGRYLVPYLETREVLPEHGQAISGYGPVTHP